MPAFVIFQCIPAYRPLAVSRLIRKIISLGSRILIDLEDGIQDVLFPEHTGFLKARAREDVLRIIGLSGGIPYYLRINPRGTEEYIKDLELIRECPQKPAGIFLPKLEKPGELEGLVSDLEPVCHKKPVIDPILESSAGILAMNEIFNNRVRQFIEFVFFGNYDFHLNVDHFPVREQDSPLYWELVGPIAENIESLGLSFGNSPYAYLHDEDGIRIQVRRLSTICRKEFAMMSLHLFQTAILQALRDTGDIMVPSFRQEKRYTPAQLIGDFRNHRLKSRSFSIETGADRLITPQEYLLALKRNHE